jgi:hypothetical protein
MASSQSKKDELLEMLEGAGWRCRQDELVALHGTIWLDVKEPWAGMDDGAEFLSRMRGRLARIQANRENLSDEFGESWTNALEDTSVLIACLERLYGKCAG